MTSDEAVAGIRSVFVGLGLSHLVLKLDKGEYTEPLDWIARVGSVLRYVICSGPIDEGDLDILDPIVKALQELSRVLATAEAGQVSAAQMHAGAVKILGAISSAAHREEARQLVAGFDLGDQESVATLLGDADVVKRYPQTAAAVRRLGGKILSVADISAIRVSAGLPGRINKGN